MKHLHNNGWQLHFAGKVAPDPQSAQLARRLVRAATGFPVTFHFGLPFDALRDLYRRSSIYWHATGYGFPADDYPDLQEHLGNTTVEAMSAGAIPVVINTGGQRELVMHERDGFVWNDLPELVKYTEHWPMILA